MINNDGNNKCAINLDKTIINYFAFDYKLKMFFDYLFSYD